MSRGGVDFDGIGVKYATFKAAAALVSVVAAGDPEDVEGKAVAVTGNQEAGYGSDGDALLGKILKYEDDDLMSVQYAGYAEMPGVSGTMPTAGNYLVVNGSGAVKASTGATGPAKAINVDSTASVNTVVVLIG